MPKQQKQEPQSISTKRSGRRLILYVSLALMFLTAYFVLRNASRIFHTTRSANFQTLLAVTKTAAVSIDTDKLMMLSWKYPNMDDIKQVGQDSLYDHFHFLLKEIQDVNNLQTPVYILQKVKRQDSTHFQFLATSAEDPYFRHEYHTAPATLIDSLAVGGTIGPYTDEHGTWLSAFYPIKNKRNQVLGVVQADIHIEDFQEMTGQLLLTDLGLLALVVLLIVGLLLKSMKNIINNDNRQKEELENKNQEILSQLEEIEQQNEYIEQQRQELERQNIHVLDSIRYARRIQSALLPPIEQLKAHLPDSFVLYKPKDIVSGDFYWFYSNELYSYLAVIDCTGHGVPGAMVSVMANNALNEIIVHQGEVKPGTILAKLNREINILLRQNDMDNSVRDGMDIGLVTLCKTTRRVFFSGAKIPLYVVQEGKLVQYRGDKASIGGSMANASRISFDEHEFEFTPNCKFFLSTDGYRDQFHGETGRKFMAKRYKERILAASNLESMDKARGYLEKVFLDWKGKGQQTDDVLVVGFTMVGHT